MKKIISVTAVLLMLSFVMIDSHAVFAGGGPVTPAPMRRTVPTPTPKKTTPANPAAPVTPAAPSAPAATVPMAYPGAGYPYSNANSCNYGNCGDLGNYGVCGGGFSAGCRQSQNCNRGTTVIVDCGGSNRGRCSENFQCRGGRGLVVRLLNQGNIAGARAVLRSMNRSLYFGGCGGCMLKSPGKLF